MSVKTTNPELLFAIVRDLNPPLNPYSDGYGRKIPTAYRVQYGDKPIWRRVYVMQFANAGSGYIIYYGEELFLDIDTEYALSYGLPPRTGPLSREDC